MLQSYLSPETVIFLGDLFDGGREWLPASNLTSDTRWGKYGEDFWHKEFRRFGGIYFDEWARGRHGGRYGHSGRKLLTSLPGNHDLGLGNGIKIPVRKRFNVYFGDGNRIDVIGNHTFVSLDTVSLSAKGQQDPATGSQGSTTGAKPNEDIWGPVEDFLSNAKETKTRIIDRAVRIQEGRIENDKLFHEVLDIKDPLASKSLKKVYTSQKEMPSILLTHVPLYRTKGTPCGPLRERYPPSKLNGNGEPLYDDPQNAIKVEAGLQYQNVLLPEISNEIVEKIGDVEYVFSGDDHDYCDIIHRGYTSRMGGIREITVKSISWAMGVRKPGFLMASLWNPLNDEDRSHATLDGSHSSSRESNQTIQTNLCLLPDQLSIFIRYGLLLGLTLVILFIRAIKRSSHISVTQQQNGHLLPFTKSKPEPPMSDIEYGSSSYALSSLSHQVLAVRSSMAKSRSKSPRNGYSFPGNPNANLLHDDPLDEQWAQDRRNAGAKDEEGYHSPRRRQESRISRTGKDFGRSVLFVGAMSIGWYIWLVIRV